MIKKRQEFIYTIFSLLQTKIEIFIFEEYIMKKFIVIALIIVLGLVSLVACQDKPQTVAEYTVMTPDGAPSMAVAKMMMDNNQFGRKAEYSIIGSETVAASFTNGDADFIIAPTNAGIMLSNKLGTYKMVAVTSWGNLYLVGLNSFKALDECADVNEFLSQFEGNEIASIGTGLVPDKTFQHILDESKINATLTASNAGLIQAGLSDKSMNLAILGEPAVTATLIKATEAKRLCSVSELWEKVTGGAFTQAGLFVKSSIIEKDPDAVKNFVEELKKSVEFLNASSENAKMLGDYMENTGKSTLKGAVVSKCYLEMSQNYVDALSVKADVLSFAKVLGVNVPESADVFFKG